jgi:hypothetical protein
MYAFGLISYGMWNPFEVVCGCASNTVTRTHTTLRVLRTDRERRQTGAGHESDRLRGANAETVVTPETNQYAGLVRVGAVCVSMRGADS